MNQRKYIRGWRQISAIYYFCWALFTGNWLAAKRELEIMSGFAKPYGVRFTPSFFKSYQETFKLTDEQMAEVKAKFIEEYGCEAVLDEDTLSKSQLDEIKRLEKID